MQHIYAIRATPSIFALNFMSRRENSALVKIEIRYNSAKKRFSKKTDAIRVGEILLCDSCLSNL